MKNKTALQTLIEWGDKMIHDHPFKILSFAEAIDKAEELLEMEKQQIKDAYEISYTSMMKSEQYYNETYGKQD